MAGAIHSALALNNVIKYLEPVEFCDIKGRPHHRYADDPLNNAGEQNLRFFRDTAPSEESKRWIDEYNDWRLENLIAIIHGDMKIGPSGNLVNGYFIDPSQWGMSTELDDLAYTYSDIALYQGLEWYNTQVDKYMDYRKSHDPEFVSDLIARKSYMHNKHIRAMALQQQLALRDSVMKKRDIADPVHKKAREGYHHHLEEVTAWLRNPKAH